MKPVSLTFFFCLILGAAQSQKTDYWQQELKYDIDVKLDDSTRTLDGYLKLKYINHSPDTLHFIWFHLWPNAFKNDRTAFSDQLLENGRTDFYFSDDKRRGYINRLDFRVDQEPLKTEDHPNYIDVQKIILPSPLPPGGEVLITTPFHIKLSYNFSRGGYVQKTFQITQWYPKPAVYDKNGWHEMPYLDQGEFYSEFGSFAVKITLPSAYTVAATGLPQRLPEDSENKTISGTAEPSKTLVYHQDSVHDFAWFADKNFIEKKDTLLLPSGRVIKLQVYQAGGNQANWGHAMNYLKEAIRVHSFLIGEYPYPVATVVQGKMGVTGGMEYPTITLINNPGSSTELEHLIFHEVGHNWFYGILASNERQFSWMDEGFNTYFDNRHLHQKSTADAPYSMVSLEELSVQAMESFHLDQPINTPADSLTAINSNVISYLKTASWLELLEEKIGREKFDIAMQQYFREWKFRHPYPEDILRVFSTSSGEDLREWYSKIDTTGFLKKPGPRSFRIRPFFAPNPDLKYNNLFIAPLIGFNNYDGFMAGVLLHNYTLPASRFQYAVAPMYGFKSRQLDGIGRLSYRWNPKKTIHEVELFMNGSKFTMDDFTDEGGNRFRLSFQKLVPGIRLEFKEKSARSTLMKYIVFKQFLIREDELSFYKDTVQQINLANKNTFNSGISQLTLGIDQFRKLYPYNAELRMEASKNFGRLTFTGNYFFNYKKKGGINLRFFAGKFFYFTEKTSSEGLATDQYHLNMTGPKGDEDYTYSNYFAGRNEFEGFYSQQIMIRDGAFKVRTDMLSSKIGKTDDWLTALNLTVDIPDKMNPFSLLPVDIPIRIFVDAGTYADVWAKDATDPRLVFDAGFQVSLFWSAVNIYIPIIYSNVYKDYFKSVPGNGFWNRISFSIDLPAIHTRKAVTQLYRRALR